MSRVFYAARLFDILYATQSRFRHDATCRYRRHATVAAVILGRLNADRVAVHRKSRHRRPAATHNGEVDADRVGNCGEPSSPPILKINAAACADAMYRHAVRRVTCICLL